jgi:hypothetical protein
MRVVCLIGLTCVGFASCSQSPDTNDKNWDTTVAYTNDAVNALRSVKDDASAASAAPKLKEIYDKMERAASTAPPVKLTRDEQSAVIERHRSQLEASKKALLDQLTRIQTLRVEDKDFNDAFASWAKYHQLLTAIVGGESFY